MRNWLIRKLGGIIFSDLPLDIRVDLMKRQASNGLDKFSYQIFKKGFGTSYSIKP